ncbi:hypothetical protein AiwAL_02925 [Acidiphilium sp. AL]|uniref:Uncharacterized protein n=1 Tax=Acidiphilium iwatense TaxID=768198 RepID=A0ABS9DX92_9PROT|nr:MULTISPECIES: hypothetical protein [Acidiphilium]MCF3946062.1 hypothetical protein [Acidiphilium iwatense]MCU4159055.1 hypothetical protein [Acidiphilium sp. AL]
MAKPNRISDATTKPFGNRKTCRVSRRPDTGRQFIVHPHHDPGRHPPLLAAAPRAHQITLSLIGATTSKR